MGTRTQIAFEDTTVKVYQHYDGYPQGVLPDLVEFVNHFMQKRRYCPCYMPARYLMRLGAIESCYRDRGDWSESNCLGHGVGTRWHGDIHYKYFVNKNGSINIIDVYRETEVYIPPKSTVKDALKIAEKLTLK